MNELMKRRELMKREVMDKLIEEFADILRAKGYENVEDFINVEGDRVATFEHDGGKYLLAIDFLR